MADLAQSAVVVRVRTSQGRLKFRTATVTSDGSGTTIPASHFDMNYIDHAILINAVALSDSTDFNSLTYPGSTVTLTLAGTQSSGSTYDLMVWGW
jgi:hypothetical protein